MTEENPIEVASYALLDLIRAGGNNQDQKVLNQRIAAVKSLIKQTWDNIRSNQEKESERRDHDMDLARIQYLRYQDYMTKLENIGKELKLESRKVEIRDEALQFAAKRVQEKENTIRRLQEEIEGLKEKHNSPPPPPNGGEFSS